VAPILPIGIVVLNERRRVPIRRLNICKWLFRPCPRRRYTSCSSPLGKRRKRDRSGPSCHGIWFFVFRSWFQYRADPYELDQLILVLHQSHSLLLVLELNFKSVKQHLSIKEYRLQFNRHLIGSSHLFRVMQVTTGNELTLDWLFFF